jgi:hypothetical protein
MSRGSGQCGATEGGRNGNKSKGEISKYGGSSDSLSWALEWICVRAGSGLTLQFAEAELPRAIDLAWPGLLSLNNGFIQDSRATHFCAQDKIRLG